jgi:hypothetical protein
MQQSRVWWRLRAASRLWASRVWALRLWASTGSAEAKSPNAEATRAAPPSFITLARERALLSRPIARSSKERANPSSLLGDNATPPFLGARSQTVASPLSLRLLLLCSISGGGASFIGAHSSIALGLRSVILRDVVLPRVHLTGTWVNKGMKKGRSGNFREHPFRDCMKRLGGDDGVVLRRAKTPLFQPFSTPYTGQIRGRDVARPPCHTVS